MFRTFALVIRHLKNGVFFEGPLKTIKSKTMYFNKFRSTCIALLVIVSFSLSSCTKDALLLSEAEVTQGLKEALTVGTSNSTANANKTDGYYLNPRIKIPFPSEAVTVENTLRNLGQDKLVDDFIQKLNRAAEDAAIKAKPIFINAITSITIQDGFSILKGSDDAATVYLKSKTYNELNLAFKPGIQKSLDDVGASKAWSAVTSFYNQIPFVTTVNTDLADYTTKKGLDGLFVLVSDEEGKIRKDPAARVNDILKKVFSENNQ